MATKYSSLERSLQHRRSYSRKKKFDLFEPEAKRAQKRELANTTIFSKSYFGQRL